MCSGWRDGVSKRFAELGDGKFGLDRVGVGDDDGGLVGRGWAGDS